MRLPSLAETLPRRWAAGRRRSPRSPEVLFEALQSGETGDWTLLDWLHTLRHKARWDRDHPEQADRTAEQIWRAAAQHPLLRGQVLARMVDGLCGGEGLASSMIAACRRIRPLAGTDPLLQEVIAALSVVKEHPEQVIALCMTHNRSPGALLLRAGLPGDLAVLDHVHAAIPQVMQAHAGEAASARQGAQWLLMSLREAPPETQDQIARALLGGLSAEEARALPDLCWWLGEAYGQEAPHTRWARLPAAAQEALGRWRQLA